MKLSILALLVGSAAAFAPNTGVSRTSVSTSAAIDDLQALAEKSNPVLKFYDPLQLSSASIYGESTDASIAFLRHAEIKHGRVAMAAFVGYIAQSNGLHFPWPMTFGGTPFPSEAGSPPEQWDALPDGAKWQIILFIGFLEWFSEAAGSHYMRGGTPGAFPKFSDNSELIPHPVPLNLFDPFGFSKNKSAEAKASGLVKELNNGRLAQIGIMGFLAEQRVEGSVPLLHGLVPHYNGETMAPFS
uniref:Plastid light harvesting protein n=1 Tax=Eucampia antarctica TaxID=49252 RepID=A0A7S2WPD2_9STRA|mmetsp:Transcript_7353/g.6947  ORF Transcript_7353/g.6947 Transcript_7353/m.6947 type:complete len:243 (+) Transcript_7353:78-806(+)|eukprot:CAMPEP_0197831232 /NCGR_PEP_ID=MMETSP1437-20131217/8420_1 /TAXON_ID=49252 ORGANISM="Eucampia antarctica, Strain CCMP1452" /NCGR_SAMPLE_ID=MMETSP1437 /ASSEMBLY_ACC=CAM_ASM_001096 /LENGTH=242 /DNA_ID=CAMNT_0043434059 /DNA_START=78 /DNA_END=806 /DNA_ORIENTATION=+